MSDHILIRKENVEDILDLTGMQKGMLYYYISDATNSLYQEQMSITLKGIINIEIIQKAWKKVVETNEMIRTVFKWDKLNKPVQIVLKKYDIPFEVIDLSRELDIDSKYNDFFEAKQKENINIQEESIRIIICKINKNTANIIIKNHHIIYDGWSNGIILKEFVENYNSYLVGEKTEHRVKNKYKEYINIKSFKWQNEEFSEMYWKSYLSNIEQNISKIDKSIVKEFKKYICKFSNRTQKVLENYTRKKRVSNATILYSVWAILQSKYLNENDIVFGTTVSGRAEKIKGINDIVGLFINTVPLRIKLSERQEINELIESVDKNLNERLEYENTELIDIKKYSGISSKDDLFNTIMVIDNYPLDKCIYENNLANITDYKIEESTSFDLTIQLNCFDSLEITVSYNSNIYNDDYIKNMVMHYETLINQVAEESVKLVLELEMLSEEEKQKILVHFNNTKVEYPKDQTIHELFEKQVEKTSNSIALVYKNKEMTYGELNEEANQLARLLKEQYNIKNGEVVCIHSNRSIEMIIGIIATLKANAVCLPIESNYPISRVSEMVIDSNTKIIINDNENIKYEGFEGISIKFCRDKIAKYEKNNLKNSIEPSDLAYLIYTSGSTGKPKAVEINHKGIINHAFAKIKEANMSERDICCHNLRFNFVASIWQIFAPMFLGSRVYLYEDSIIGDGCKLFENIEKNNVSIVEVVPSLLNSFLKEENLKDVDVSMKNVRKILLTGEKVMEVLINKFYSRYKVELINAYGQSEFSDDTLHYHIPYNNNTKKVLIGKPANNTRIYILDNLNKIVPIGVIGELCISGEGLARGYLNRLELTAEKFISNPYEPGTKMYKTGDLARWLPDGNIEYLGRIDNQVKIRGFRIELGEIENELLKNEEIKEAVVVDKEDKQGNKYLCAYLVCEKEILIPELRRDLSKALPDYMVPSYFIQVKKMPLTPNGKIDRKALPEPDGEINTGVEYIAPRNEIEEKLVKVWSEILEVGKIGIDDDFFTLGGHSLKAIQVISMIHKELNVEVPVSEVFSNPTIRQLGEYIGKCKECIYFSIKAAEEREVYKVSSAQKRLFALNQFEKESTNYNIPSVMVVEGKLEKCRVEETFRKLVERHEAFKTSFELVNEEIVQRIHKKVVFNIEYEKINETKEEVINDQIKKFIRPFDLSKSPLLRIKLVEVNEDKHLLMVDMHHIVSDGTTIGILIEEFAKIYKGEELEPLRIQYKDYAAWENELLESEGMKSQEEYWVNVFSDEIPVLNMPTDYARPTEQSFEGNSIDFRADKELTEKLRKIGDDSGSTMYMTLLSAYNILLSRYSGQNDIIVGSPIAGRNHAELEGIVGMFVNTLAMRNYPKGEKTFKEFLQSAKENAIKAYENQEYQFDKLVEKVQVGRDLSRNALFDTMFVLQNTDSKEIEIDDLRFEACNFENKISKFDLTLTAVEMNEEIGFSLEYCTKLFKRETVERIAEHFLNVLRNIAENEDIKISEIEMLSEEEKRRILVDFNDTKTEYPKDKTIHELFEEQVEKTPDNIAVVFEDKKLTYRELNEKSNSLARVLREKGVKADSIVGIMVERSIEMMIGIMGILKAGGAYLPIDPNYPKERIEYILQDSESNILLSTQVLSNNVIFNGEIIDVFNEDLYQCDKKNLEKINTSSHLAYVIYTSGTTGVPKGVMIEHKSVNNLVLTLKKNIYSMYDSKLRVALVAPYYFDASVKQIFVALINGDSIYIVPEDTRKSGELLLDYYEINRIDISDGTPVHLNMLANLINNKKSLKLKHLIIGGDSLEVATVQKIYINLENIKISNVYGPTECCVDSTIFLVESQEVAKIKNISIGKPISNASIYIVGENNKLQPIGVVGELCIAGDGLARGYLNRPELTAEKFVANPYEQGKKMYRTGDLARWLLDGNIEYLGRIDQQVKIRGFRIELGEIENQLLKNDGIKEAVVMAKGDKQGNKYLCAYIVSEKEITIQELRGELSKVVPYYMVPSYFMQIEKMPLTPNGKIDRKTLPEPDGDIVTGVEYMAARNELEKKLVEIWEGVLGVSNIGINDDFFSLGGDSIKSIQLISRAKAMGYSFEVKDLFNNPNIKDLSQCVKQNTLIIEQGEVDGDVDLTPIQKWFFEMDFEEKHHWNQAVMLFSKYGFEEQLLEKVFKSIVIHHDALRIIYKNEDNEMHQVNRNSDGKLYDLSIYDYRDVEAAYENEIKEICNEIQGSISLEEGPLVKLGLFKTNEGDHLLIAIHHLVIDGVSWRILFEDLAKAYTMAKKGEEIILQEKTTSFKEWAKEQKEYANTYDIKKQLEYWNSIEEKDIKKLPKDKEADKSIANDLRSIGFELTQEETKYLLNNVNGAYNTEINDILLAALALTINQWTSDENETILINLESHGREEIIKNVDITRTIGWFTSQYPVVLKANNEDLAMMIKDTKDSLRRIPNKGIGHGIIKYISKNKFSENVEFKLKPEICFNYLGQFDEDIINDVFSISRFDIGNSISIKNKNLYSLYFSGILVAKSLSLNIRYSYKEYTEETIKLLINNYKINLIKIINHCLNKEGKEKTAADVTKENISLYELKPYLEDINNIKDIYPLTPMQEGMLYHILADKESEAYSEELSIKIKGQLDINILEESFNRLIERHDVLRTAFDYESFNKSMQIVFNERKTNIRYEDISKEEFDKEVYIQEIIKEHKKKGFNINKDILIKLTIIKTESELYSLILSNHHIIIDGWCLSIIMVELFKIYNELKYGYKAELKEVVPYSDYIEWSNNKDKEEAKEYWTNYLSDYTEATMIPFKNNEEDRNYKNSEVNFVIEIDTTKLLKEIAINNKVTANTIIQSIWSILLQKYNNSNDSLFGYVVSGRNPEVKGIENMLGLFINTIPLRVKTEDKMTFKELLNSVNNSFLGSSEYDFYPLAEIQALSEVKEHLINNIMVFENYPVDSEGINNEVLNKNDLEIINVSSEEQTNYNFNVIVSHQDKIMIKFNFNESLYSKNNVLRIKEHFENIIKQVVSNEKISLKDIEILGEDEKHKLLVEFNDTAVKYPRNKTIHELFEEQVEKTPNNIAVVFEDIEITYKELNEKANSLARTLREKGVKQESIVGIIVESSIEMVVGMIAILKAGGAYLPIDPEYPEDRIKYMLDNSRAKILVSQEKQRTRLLYEGEFIDVDSASSYSHNVYNVGKTSDPNNLAYVIYTSGTTGKPKGVMIEHRNICSALQWRKDQCDLKTEDTTLQLFSNVFDGFVTSFYTPIISGSKVIILSKESSKDIYDIKEAIVKHKVTNFICIPSLCLAIMECLNSEDAASLRIVTLAGDQLTESLVSKCKSINEDLEIVNEYGPTENSVISTIKRNILVGTKITIGKPIGNTKIYILDKSCKNVPIGVVGELCISGDGLARGYLNKPELTAEKFIENPYEPGERMYRTGDLARWLPDGNIEFLGRIDNQVKIRGFRIELGEIENQLLKNEKIKGAIVVDKEDKDGNKYLCAYVVSENEVTTPELRGYLSKVLPDYMIPSYFMHIENMPLTQNGKIDRKALPELDGDINTGVEYVAPRNEIEEKLVKVWSEILGVEKIGIDDDFFTLGGHSLKAIQVISMIHKELNVEVPVSEIFSNATIRQLGKYIGKCKKSIYSSIKAVEEREVYKVSSAQKRLFALNQFGKGEVNYNIPAVMIVEAKLKKSRVEEIFRKLVKRHEAFRTSFEVVNEEIVQRIYKEVEFNVEYEEISAVKEEVINRMVDNFIRPFDLSKAPLLRVKLVEISEEKHILMVDMHHIISDGTTIGILIEEFTKIYRGEKLEDLRIQYKDYAAWENELLDSEGMKKQEEYWMKVFSDEIAVLNMPTDYARPTVQSFEGDSIEFKVDKELTEQIRKIGDDNGATMYMTLLSAYNILLSRYSGQEDIIIGSPIAGRSHADLEAIVGMFVNTLAMRNYPKGEKTFKEFLQSVKKNALKAYENQDYQFDELIEKIQVRRDLSRNALFDTMFVLQNTDHEEIEIDDLKFKAYNFENKISKFDLTLTAVEINEEIGFSLEYCTKLFKRETVERIGNHFLNILKEISENEDIRISEIEMLSEEEKRIILVDFNDTKREYAKDKTMHELFEEQVEKTPDNVAIVFKDKWLTYKELNEKANSLARILREKRVEQESIVGIIVERSLEMMIGIMGILKAGGAYLPIDPEYPQDRIEYMLKDSSTKILLTQNNLMKKIKFDGIVVDLENEELYEAGKNNLVNVNNSSNLAYVIYTSGSTGKPKGVMLEHRNAVNFITGVTSEIEMNEKDSILALTTISFDIFFLETLLPLTKGLKVIIVDKSIQKDANKLSKFVCENSINIIQVTPSRIQLLLNSDKNLSSLSKVDKLLVGGESLPQSLFEELKKLKRIKLYNMYGPTETTVWSSIKELTDSDSINIGKPISNTSIYIVGKNNELQPIGVAGELCIAGDGLARGYLNRPELTEERFVSNLYEPGAKMYKTGDLAIWLSDGNIECLGRIDNQVKIRGFRIELGEIENQLLKNEEIKEAVVVDKEGKDGNKYLCAYLACEKEIVISELRRYLSKVLPDYMIPSYFMKIEKMPLTPNGKIDRKALPQPDGDINTGVKYVAPRNEIEEKLVKVWSEVLGIENIGIHDDFFTLGGDSIKAIRLVSMIHRELNVEVPVNEIFKILTLKGIGEYILESEKNNYSIIQKVEEQKYYPIVGTQKRLFAVNQFNKQDISYNMPVVAEIEGNVDVAKLEDAFNNIINRHEVFRTCFKLVNGEPVQIISKRYKFKLNTISVKNSEVETKIKELIIPFNLEEAPLLRVNLIKTEDNMKILMIDIPHIIADGVSNQIMVKELIELYNGNILSEINIQYKDYSVWKNNYLNSNYIKLLEKYWIEKTKDFSYTCLPKKYELSSGKSIGCNKEIYFNKEEYLKIDMFCKKNAITKFAYFTSILNIILMNEIGKNDISIGVPVEGRNHEQLQNLIGLFLNVILIRTSIDNNKNFKEYLHIVNETISEALAYQEYPYEELYDKTMKSTGVKNQELFSIMLNYMPYFGDGEVQDIKFDGFTIKKYKHKNIYAKYDVTFYVKENKEDILINMVYKNVFEESTMERVARAFNNISEIVIRNDMIKIKDIEYGQVFDEGEEVLMMDDYFENEEFFK